MDSSKAVRALASLEKCLMRYAIPRSISVEFSRAIHSVQQYLDPVSPFDFSQNWVSIGEIASQIISGVDRPSVISACLEQLQKVVDSMESAEDAIPEVDSHTVNAFSSLFRKFDTLRSSLQTGLESNEFDSSASLVRDLTVFMDQTFRPLFARTTTKRFVYSRQGIDRIDVSVQCLSATDRMYRRLREDIDETEQKLIQMGILVPLPESSGVPPPVHRRREKHVQIARRDEELADAKDNC
jgi:hypothetical protein